MLISFVGSSCSGKTTTAAMTFAKLKQSGISAEFIPEQARWHIASKRVERHLLPVDALILTDEDQIQIMSKQLEAESLMLTACGQDVVLVSDTCALNSLLYMSDTCRKDVRVQGFVEEALRHYQHVFYCPPVRMPLCLDPNRVHDEEASKLIDASIPLIMGEFAPGLSLELLFGDPDLRAHRAFMGVLDLM